MPTSLRSCPRSASSPSPVSTVGWYRRPRWPSTSASAWPTAFRCSGCRCPRPWAYQAASGLRAGHGLHRASLLVAMRLADLDARLDLHPVLHLPRLLGSHLGWLAGTRRSAQGRRRVGTVLVWRSADFGAGRVHPPDLADVDRLRASLAVSAWAWVTSRRFRP